MIQSRLRLKIESVIGAFFYPSNNAVSFLRSDDGRPISSLLTTGRIIAAGNYHRDNDGTVPAESGIWISWASPVTGNYVSNDAFQ